MVFNATFNNISVIFRVGREIPVAGIPNGNYREIPSYEIL
jgi:hypothetical protein